MCIGSLWMPRDGDHAAGLDAGMSPSGAGRSSSAAGPAQRARGPNVACTGDHSGAPAARCSSSHVSTSPAGAARSPQSSSSVASTSTSHGPSSVRRALEGGSRGCVSPAPPHTSSAHGPSVEGDADADAALDRLGLDAAAGAGERLPQLGRAGHARDDDARSSAGCARRIEPVADAAVPRVQVVGVGRHVDLGGARVDGRDEQHGALAVAPQERRDRRPHDARHVGERLAERVRRRDVARGARREARGERGDRPVVVVAGRARRERADRDQGPAGVDELGQAPRGRGLEHLAPGQDDRAVRLVRGRQRGAVDATRPRPCRRRARRSRARAG